VDPLYFNKKSSAGFLVRNKLKRPRIGETVRTSEGEAKIIAVVGFKDAVEEMIGNGVPLENIKRFELRIMHFLGDKHKYFECEVEFPGGEIRRIDWSEYFSQIDKAGKIGGDR
jgi:hypothetical protein